MPGHLWCSYTRVSTCVPILIILLTIQQIHGKDLCVIVRNASDSIHVVPPRCNATRYICQTFGAGMGDATNCICTCPTYRQTYMENTEKCTANKDVWPGL